MSMRWIKKPALGASCAFAAFLIVPAAPCQDPARQDDPKPRAAQEEPKPHSEEMTDRLPTDVEDLIQGQLFEVDSQIQTVRTLLQRTQAILVHRAAAEAEQQKLEYYSGLLGSLQRARKHLAELRVQTARCTIACSQAEKTVLEAKTIPEAKEATSAHHAEMMARAKAAREAFHELRAAVAELEAADPGIKLTPIEARRQGTDKAGLSRLIEYLTRESAALGSVLAVCESAIRDAHAQDKKSNEGSSHDG